MVFQQNIPLSSDLISVSQGDLQGNFQSLYTSWNVNHVDFDDASTGKHKFVEMTNQGSDPAGSGSEFTIFSKVSGGGQSEIFYKRNAEATAYQLTGKNPSAAASGYTFLPGAMLMQWSLLTGDSKKDGAEISFPTIFSATPYSLQLTASRNGVSVNVLNATLVTETGFILRTSSNSNDGVWYLAVGPS